MDIKHIQSNEIVEICDMYMQSFWYSYQDIYKQVGQLYEIINSNATNVILISIGRGGWIVTRMLSAYFEKCGKETPVYSITVSYLNRNTLNEQPALLQGLDRISIEKIKEYLFKGYKMFVIDVPFVTGQIILYAINYLYKVFSIKPFTAVIHIVEFSNLNNFPNKKPPIFKPDIYIESLKSDGIRWYVQYPWEWTNYELYNKAYNCFKLNYSLNDFLDCIKQLEV